MNEQTARELLMELLYGEISNTDKAKLEHYLQSHPEMQQELDELKSVRSLLQEAPEVETKNQLLPMTSQKRSFSEWWSQAGDLLPRSGWGKTMVAAAACFMLFFVSMAAANLNIHSTKNGFAFHLGYGQQITQPHKKISQLKPLPQSRAQPKPQQVVLTKKQMKTIIKKMRINNAKLLAKYAQKLTQQTRQQLQQVVNYFQQKRINNLKLVKKTLEHYQAQLNQYQHKTNYRLMQTHQVMGKMAKAIIASNRQ